MSPTQACEVGVVSIGPLASCGAKRAYMGMSEGDDVCSQKRRRTVSLMISHTKMSCQCWRSRSRVESASALVACAGGARLLEQLGFMSERLLSFLGPDGAANADARQLVSSGRAVACCLCEGAVPLLLSSAAPLAARQLERESLLDEAWREDEEEESYALVRRWASFVAVAGTASGRASAGSVPVFDDFRRSAQNAARTRRVRRTKTWRKLLDSGPASCSVQ